MALHLSWIFVHFAICTKINGETSLPFRSQWMNGRIVNSRTKRTINMFPILKQNTWIGTNIRITNSCYIVVILKCSRFYFLKMWQLKSHYRLSSRHWHTVSWNKLRHFALSYTYIIIINGTLFKYSELHIGTSLEIIYIG